MEDSLTLYGMVRDFEVAEDATSDSRKLAERDADYFHEKQWTAEEKQALEKRGQPAITFNRIKRKVNSLQGLEKQTRKDPKAFPRNPDDEEAARAATDALRYVCENTRWDDKRSECALELAVQGTCAVMVGVREEKGGVDPDIKRIAWDRFYYDPHSCEFDFADAKFLGVVVWMDLDDASATYPEGKEALTDTWKASQDSDTYDDKPKWQMWADYKRKRVRVCEHYYREGDTWKFCIFTKGGFVVKPQDSPYQGEDGKPECPIKAVSLYVDRDNNRYGEVRTMIGPQDEINKRRSKALHLINQRQVRVSPVVAESPDAVRKELARPDGVFVGEAGDVEILPTNDMAAANLQLLQEAKAEIDLLGPNAALAGKNEQQMSGRAIMAQQQGGMTESATYLDRIKTLSLAVYRSAWCRVRQFWKDERWVRVTDNDMNVKFVGLNRPITMIQAAAKQMGVTKDNLQQQPPEVQQQLQLLASDPRSQQVIGYENNVTELDVDIIIDEGIDTPTVQAEQFDTLVKMLPVLGPAGASPEVLKMVIQASQLRDKDKLLELFEPKEGQAPPPSQEEMMAMEMQAQQQQAQMEGQIEIEKAQIKAQSDIEVAKIKADADMQIKVQSADIDAQLSERKMMLDHEVKSRVAEATGQAERDKEASDKTNADKEAQMAIMAQLAQILMDMNRPKTKVPIRDENGFIVAVQEIMDEVA